MENVPGSVVFESLNEKDPEMRALPRHTDNIVRRGCRNAGDMSSVSETVPDAADVAILAHNLRGQVGVGIIDARIHDANDNARVAESNLPCRRHRHRGWSPLVDTAVMRAGVHRAVVRIIWLPGGGCGGVRLQDRLYSRVELGELNVRSLAQVPEKGQSRLRWRVEMGDADFVYSTDDLRAEGGVELVEHVLARCGLESNQDVTSAYAAW